MEDQMEAAIIATHRRPALVAALLTLIVAALTGCQGGVDVAVVGIPADTQVTVSVDSLRQDIAAAPSKVYRYKGVGYARLHGLAAAPSYTATARRLDGCAVAVGSVEYDGSDEVRIDLHAVDGCGKPALPAPDPQPVAPSPQPQPMPQPQPQPQPAPDADKDGVPDLQDLCPLLAGSQTNTSRLGCPMPRTVAAQLVPMVKGGMQTAAGYDFTVSTTTQYIDYLIILPTEAATARQVRVDYSIAATAKWAPADAWCASQGHANRHHIGTGAPGTQNYCSAYGYRAGLSTMTMQPGEFIVESGRSLGDAPTQIKATTPAAQLGVVSANQQNVLRLLVSGTVLLTDVAATATIRMEW
jgi:hypothetical protein